jgi:hypothetical protein
MDFVVGAGALAGCLIFSPDFNFSPTAKFFRALGGTEIYRHRD